MSDYAKHTIGSKNPLKRWLHRQRFRVSLKLLDLKSGQRFLDYGCGDGELAFQARMHCSGVKVVAFDPVQELYEQASHKLNSFPDVVVTRDFGSDMGKFDKIACLEAVEHLPKKELGELFDNISSVLKEDGFCLFTFPIEHGFISLIKNFYRKITSRDKYVSFERAFRSFFGLPVEREAQKSLSDCNYIYSHVGFDCNKMIGEIRRRFNIKKIHVLPIGVIPFGLGNSVAIIACKRAINVAIFPILLLVLVMPTT